MAPAVAEELSFDTKFLQSLARLEPVESSRVLRAVDQYSKDPDSPGLNLELLSGISGKQRLWSIRASQELRVLIARQGNTTVFLRAGHHDAVYDLANKSAFVVPEASEPGLVAITSGVTDLDGEHLGGLQPPTGSLQESAGRSILEHWSTSELENAGFDSEEIARLRTATADTLLDIWPDIDENSLELRP